MNTLAAIAEKKATFRSFADTWADTAPPRGRLMLTVSGELPEFERDLIRARSLNVGHSTISRLSP